VGNDHLLHLFRFTTTRVLFSVKSMVEKWGTELAACVIRGATRSMSSLRV
jgi:hypothetical protein